MKKIKTLKKYQNVKDIRIVAILESGLDSEGLIENINSFDENDDILEEYGY